MAETAITSKADLEDQRWLDQQVATLGDGIEAARDIWANWSDLRNVGRLHPDQSAGEYIASLGFRLTLAEGLDVMPGASSRQLAAATGASQSTARRVQRESFDSPDARVIGADGKSYPGRVVREVTAEVIEPDAEAPDASPALAAFVECLTALTTLRKTPPQAISAAVFQSNVPRTRAELKRVHQWMGELIHVLDQR